MRFIWRFLTFFGSKTVTFRETTPDGNGDFGRLIAFEKRQRAIPPAKFPAIVKSLEFSAIVKSLKALHRSKQKPLASRHRHRPCDRLEGRRVVLLCQVRLAAILTGYFIALLRQGRHSWTGIANAGSGVHVRDVPSISVVRY